MTPNRICIWFFRKNIFILLFWQVFRLDEKKKYRMVIFSGRTVIFMVKFLFSELIDRESRKWIFKRKIPSILSLYCYQVVHNTASAYEQIFAVVKLLCINEIVCSLKIPFALAIAMVCNLIASGCWWQSWLNGM